MAKQNWPSLSPSDVPVMVEQIPSFRIAVGKHVVKKEWKDIPQPQKYCGIFENAKRRVVLGSGLKNTRMSVLIPQGAYLYRKYCADHEKDKLIQWFRNVEVQAWDRIKKWLGSRCPQKIFLIRGQVLASKFWISHGLTCSIWFKNVIHRLSASRGKEAWIGEDTGKKPWFGAPGLLPVEAMEGFQEVGDGSQLLSAFIEVSWSSPPDQSQSIPTSLGRRHGLMDVRCFRDLSRRQKGHIDIVFVHGLGGSADGTWTHPKSKLFWPDVLHEQRGLERCRVLTFGYDSDWGNLFGPSTHLDISDFSVQLLNALELHHDRNGAVKPAM